MRAIDAAHLGGSFHAAACSTIGLDPQARGSRAEVARRLAVDRANYARWVQQGVSIDVVLQWVDRWSAAPLLVLVLHGGGALVTPADRAQAALCSLGL